VVFRYLVKRDYSTCATSKDYKDIRAIYRADSVGIEDLRKSLYVDTASENKDADNDVFIVHTDGENPVLPDTGTPLYTWMDVFYSYYNTIFSPRKNLVKWGTIIKNVHHKITNNIKSQATTKEFELEIDGVDENSDVDLSELGTERFIPIIYSFESHMTSDIFKLILINPHGYLNFTNNNINYSGFIKELEYEDYSGLANGKLIARNIIATSYRVTNDGDNRVIEYGGAGGRRKLS